MNTKTCYRFNKKTHEFLGADVAFQEPVGETYPLPANCTFVEPPKTEEFEVACWNWEVWEIKPDYRKRLDETGTYVGGKPFYNPENFWWAEEQYMTEIGDIPQGMSFEKMDKPEICNQIVELEDKYNALKTELEDTDYYARRLYEFENGYAEDPEKEAFYKSELQRLALERPNLNIWETEANTLKEQVKAQYGEEALNHLTT